MSESGSSKRPAPWPLRARQTVSDQRIFRVEEVQAQDPRDGRWNPRVVLACPDWVNVIPMTGDGRVIMIRQFRIGTEQVTLEIPGGMADPGEDKVRTAARELEEETGYRAEKWVHLGTSEPNPAFQTNRLHSYLALDCRRVHGGVPDEGEDIEVALLTPAEVMNAMQRGEISHALVLTAFAFEFIRAPEAVSFLTDRFGK